jgi:hypothetical protein
MFRICERELPFIRFYYIMYCQVILRVYYSHLAAGNTLTPGPSARIAEKKSQLFMAGKGSSEDSPHLAGKNEEVTTGTTGKRVRTTYS